MKDGILDGIMYRSEESGGSGVRGVIDIMTFEIFELGNTDILDYTLENYLQDTNIQEMVERLIDDITAFSINEVEKICKLIIKEINIQTDHNLKYGLWLADYERVKDMYAYDESSIEAYKVSDIILSDLGIDGVLFAYDEMPEPITE